MHTWVESTPKTLGFCIEDFEVATAKGNTDIRIIYQSGPEQNHQQ
jgi:hypothetical protein